MKVSSAKEVKAFNPMPVGAVHPTPDNLDGLTDSEVAATLALGHPKSQTPKVHKGMEGERTGLPHVVSHSSRFIKAHAARGTNVDASFKET